MDALFGVLGDVLVEAQDFEPCEVLEETVIALSERLGNTLLDNPEGSLRGACNSEQREELVDTSTELSELYAEVLTEDFDDAPLGISGFGQREVPE